MMYRALKAITVVLPEPGPARGQEHINQHPPGLEAHQRGQQIERTSFGGGGVCWLLVAAFVLSALPNHLHTVNGEQTMLRSHKQAWDHDKQR